MKKYILIGIVIIFFVFIFINNNDMEDINNNEVYTEEKYDDDKTTSDSEINTIDYSNAEIFEQALNDGASVNGKTVEFIVDKYTTTSIWGYNAWAGEHLNFISDSDLKLNVNDKVIARIVSVDKSFSSWKIEYEALRIERTTINNIETETNEEVKIDNKKIKMVESSEYYENGNWTYETLVDHFKELGFTKIEGIACKPNDDKYEKNIFEVVMCTSFFSQGPWEKGEDFDKNNKIEIYYNELPMLTIDNCEDLKKVLTGNSISYQDFVELYDGRYVKFEAVVDEHIIYMGDLNHIINVKGENVDALSIRIGDKTWGNTIDKTVQEGDNVIVKGKIDMSQSKYFKMLYVETLYMHKP